LFGLAGKHSRAESVEVDSKPMQIGYVLMGEELVDFKY
jgi:hypothetical protein